MCFLAHPVDVYTSFNAPCIGASKSMEEFNISWNHLLTKSTVAFAGALKVWLHVARVKPTLHLRRFLVHLLFVREAAVQQILSDNKLYGTGP